MLRGLTGYFMTPFDAAFDPMKFDFDKEIGRASCRERVCYPV